MSEQESGKPAIDQGADDGLQELANLWQQAPVAVPVPEAIRVQVRRQERRMRLYAWLEWIASIVIGVGGVYLMLNSEVGDAPWRALLVVLLLAWAMAFSVSNRRGIWEPLEESVRGYLDLARLRLVRKRRMLRFAWLFFIAELGIFAVWQWLSGFGWLEPIFVGDGHFALNWIAVFALAMGAWSLWYSRRIKSSEQQIAEWQQENIAATENKL
ncbi:DUF2116 family Zn-ribbon domain-containing protein [Microbulbifer elongatus]|uniref:DUF2116 family Zn-ribbon domain-containing protein n=1 Tax=Microbulbifer elongatus TaxID=86173 RepID=UPI001E48BED2|nr:DUF2116 family Zn-ribbon domain-containing protein [Microbulbifer elongatus]